MIQRRKRDTRHEQHAQISLEVPRCRWQPTAPGQISRASPFVPLPQGEKCGCFFLEFEQKECQDMPVQKRSSNVQHQNRHETGGKRQLPSDDDSAGQGPKHKKRVARSLFVGPPGH
eukprot:s135_g36.t2